jgi:hypothetical protein
MKINVPLIAVLLSVFIIGCHKSSDDYNTLSFDEIKNKLESAKDGDTINIPAGTYRITSPVTFNKSIIIIGAGIDRTIFLATTASDVDAYMLKSNNADQVRVSGITFNMSNADRVGGLALVGFHKNFRVDHCKFTELSSVYASTERRCLLLDGWNGTEGNFCGVVDHCEFKNNRSTPLAYYGDDEIGWTRPRYLGMDIMKNDGEGVVFIEDCSFICEQTWVENNQQCLQMIASNDGSRYVFRHNTINVGYAVGHHIGNIVDAHGNYFCNRGSFSFEVYENDITSVHSYRCMELQGGTGVVFNNRLYGEFTHPLDFLDYRSFNPPNMPNHGAACPHGYCACTCPDLAPDPPHSSDQINQVYVWNNSYTHNGTPATFEVEAYDEGHNQFVIKKNRDYFEPDDSGFDNYNNTGISYKETYIPFTYPHPLTKQ